MKETISALGALAVLISSIVSPARADEPRQVFDEGAFTLSYPASWAPVGEDDVSRGQALLAVRPPSGASVERFAQCSVTRTMHANNLTQPDINANVAEWTAESLREPSYRLVRFSNERLGSVQVASLVQEFSEPSSGQTLRTFERHFAVVRGREFAAFFLWCGVSIPADDGVLADVHAFLSSLTFSDRGQP